MIDRDKLAERIRYLASTPGALSDIPKAESGTRVCCAGCGRTRVTLLRRDNKMFCRECWGRIEKLRAGLQNYREHLKGVVK